MKEERWSCSPRAGDCCSAPLLTANVGRQGASQRPGRVALGPCRGCSPLVGLKWGCWVAAGL